jgi:hypothetical protein
MSKSLLRLSLVVIPLFIASHARAEAFPQPTEEYSADVLMTVKGQQGTTTMHGKVYSTKDNERRVIQAGQRETVSITDRLSKKTTILLPAQQAYMDSYHAHDAVRKDDPAGGWYRSDVRMTRVSKEEVNGVQTTKYRIYLNDPEGQISAGSLWLSAENIPIRMQGTMTQNEKTTEFQIDRTNVVIAKQSESLFAIPDGFRRIDVAAPMPFLPAPSKLPEAPADKLEHDEQTTFDKQIEELHRQIPR